MQTARRYRTVEIKAGPQILTAEEPLPDDLRHALTAVGADTCALIWPKSGHRPWINRSGSGQTEGRESIIYIDEERAALFIEECGLRGRTLAIEVHEPASFAASFEPVDSAEPVLMPIAANSRFACNAAS